MEDDRQERKKEDKEGNAEEVKRVDKSYIYRKWLHISAQYIMIAVVIGLLIYLWKNIEYAKMFTNSCGLCMDQHNVTCYTSELKQLILS